MIEGSIWKRCLSWGGISMLVVLPAPSHAQHVQNRTIEFPGGGTKNNNGRIGPFCCTGETAIIHDIEGKPAGYIYFYDFSGAKILDANQSAASSVSILISSGLSQTFFPVARFTAESWAPGTAATIQLDPLTYEVTIDPQLVTIDGHKYFDMGSLKATVHVTSKPVASAGAQPPEPPPTEATSAPSPTETARTFDSSVQDAAEEFVAEAMPMTDARRLGAQGGSILPCDLEYPDTTTTIENTSHEASPEIEINTRYAVDSAFIRQNLIAAGVPDDAALQILKDYRANRAKFDELPDPERKTLEDNQGSPEWRLIQSLNNLGISGLPHFNDPEKCERALPMKIVTPYRFTLSPSGGRMFIIPQFSFRVCQRRNIDPYSRTDCDNWVEVGTGQKAKVAGRYAYAAEWPDGRFARNVMNFPVDGFAVHDIPMMPQN